jgi:uncharacterized protein YdhG (YjbR/CyaY superfamily)
MENKKAKTVRKYIKNLPKESGKFIEELTELIRKNASDAEECISYGMPAFKIFGRILVYYAAFKNHYSLFPGAGAIEVFKDRLKGYEISKGTIKFKFEDKMPKKLISDIVKYKVKTNLDKKAKQSYK